jgi:predicted nuclease of predicted toxin-antitoxin system
MKLKLDENFDVRLVPLLRNEGFDVDTVRDEGLSGARDQTIYEVCRDSQRILVTLDLDFSNPLRFPPEPTEGIVIVRVRRPLLRLIRATLLSALPELKSGSVKGALWIVEPGRIRVHEPREETGAEESQ